VGVFVAVLLQAAAMKPAASATAMSRRA